MIDHMRGNGVEVERALLPIKFEVDEAKLGDRDAHPFTVTLQHLSEAESMPTQEPGSVPNGLFRSNALDCSHDAGARNGQGSETETIRARYVVGCDGARSWVRTQMGVTLQGDSANVHVRHVLTDELTS